MQISLHRVWLLIRKQWAENQQLYSLGILALAGIIAAVIIVTLAIPGGFSEETQQILLVFGLAVPGSLFTLTILSQFSDKHKSISALMQPASVTEKLIVAFFYSLILFPLVYFIIVLPLIYIGHYADSVVIGHINKLMVVKAKYIYPIGAGYFVLQTFAMFGSILFKRYVIIKSILLFLSIAFGIQVINPMVAGMMIKSRESQNITANVKMVLWDNDLRNPVDIGYEKQTFNPKIAATRSFSNLELEGDNHGYNTIYKGVLYNSNMRVNVANPYEWTFTALLILSFPFLWVITWFRLKEKQL
jgi:hypothetical protein